MNTSLSRYPGEVVRLAFLRIRFLIFYDLGCLFLALVCLDIALVCLGFALGYLDFEVGYMAFGDYIGLRLVPKLSERLCLGLTVSGAGFRIKLHIF